MSRIISCAVKGCLDMTSIRHRFPRADQEPEKFQVWIKALGNQQVVDMDPQAVYVRQRICQRHFAQKYLTWNNRLMRTAYPELFLPGDEGNISLYLGLSYYPNIINMKFSL